MTHLPATGQRQWSFPPDHACVLYVYPRDNTPGCTREGQDFRDLHAEFVAAGYAVWGLSRDSLTSHEKFKAAQGFPFELIADPQMQWLQSQQLVQDKTMYGKPVRGVVRTTFVFDAQGQLLKRWDKVSVSGHAQEVLEFVKALPA